MKLLVPMMQDFQWKSIWCTTVPKRCFFVSTRCCMCRYFSETVDHWLIFSFPLPLIASMGWFHGYPQGLKFLYCNMGWFQQWYWYHNLCTNSGNDHPQFLGPDLATHRNLVLLTPHIRYGSCCIATAWNRIPNKTTQVASSGQCHKEAWFLN